MKTRKLKCYVLTVSRYFPLSHPRAGEETHFAKRIMYLDKKHTVRGNYNFWKKRVDEINAGRAYLSLRFWEGLPYRSKQVEFLRRYELGIQKIEIDNTAGMVIMTIDGNEFYDEPTLCKNDGLSEDDFLNWFFPKPVKGIEIFTGAVIHFNPEFKY